MNIRRRNRTDNPPDVAAADPDRAPAAVSRRRMEAACDAVLHDWRRTWCALPEEDRPDWGEYCDGIGIEFVAWDTQLRVTRRAD